MLLAIASYLIVLGGACLSACQVQTGRPADNDGAPERERSLVRMSLNPIKLLAAGEQLEELLRKSLSTLGDDTPEENAKKLAQLKVVEDAAKKKGGRRKKGKKGRRR